MMKEYAHSFILFLLPILQPIMVFNPLLGNIRYSVGLKQRNRIEGKGPADLQGGRERERETLETVKRGARIEGKGPADLQDERSRPWYDNYALTG